MTKERKIKDEVILREATVTDSGGWQELGAWTMGNGNIRERDQSLTQSQLEEDLETLGVRVS